MAHELRDPSDPRALLEAREAETDLPFEALVADEGELLRRTLAWILEGGDLANVGIRAHIAGQKLAIDPLNPMTQDEIARMAGFVRSKVNRHAMDYTRVFGVRSSHDRSDETRRRCSESFHGGGR